MSLQQKITEDMKAGMMAKDSQRVGTLRLLIAALRNEEIAKMKKGEGLKDDETVTVIGREVKKRRDSIEQYGAAGRNDLVEQEQRELAILSAYLPTQMSETEVRAIVEATLQEVAATSGQDIGKVMKALMPKVKGKADGGLVNRIVKEKLGA